MLTQEGFGDSSSATTSLIKTEVSVYRRMGLALVVPQALQGFRRAVQIFGRCDVIDPEGTGSLDNLPTNDEISPGISCDGREARAKTTALCGLDRLPLATSLRYLLAYRCSSLTRIAFEYSSSHYEGFVAFVPDRGLDCGTNCQQVRPPTDALVWWLSDAGDDARRPSVRCSL